MQIEVIDLLDSCVFNQNWVLNLLVKGIFLPKWG